MRDDLAGIDTGRHKGGSYGRDDIRHPPAFDGEHDVRARTDAPGPRLGTRYGARATRPHSRGAAPGGADAGQRPAVPGDDQRRALFSHVRAGDRRVARSLGFYDQKAVATAVGVVGLPRRPPT